MSGETETVVIKENVSRSIKLTIALGLLAVVLIGGLIYYVLNQEPVASTITIESYGLEDTVADFTPTADGAVYYVASLAESPDTPFLFSKTLSDDLGGVVVPNTVRSAVRLDSQYLLAFVKDELFNETDPDGYVLGRYDTYTGVWEAVVYVPGYAEQQLVVSVDGAYFAYTYQPAATEGRSITDWTTVIFETGVAEPIMTLEASVQPQFVGNAVFVMQPEALTRIDLETATATNVTNLYAPYTPRTEYTISSDEETLIMTMQALSLVSIQNKVSETEYIETGRLVDGTKTFGNPYMSPDGTQYAVVSRDVNQATIEIRPIMAATPIVTIPLAELNPISVEIVDWEDGEVVVEADAVE